MWDKKTHRGKMSWSFGVKDMSQKNAEHEPQCLTPTFTVCHLLNLSLKRNMTKCKVLPGSKIIVVRDNYGYQSLNITHTS